MMSVDDLHRQAKTTTEDILQHSIGVLCNEFNVSRGTPEAKKLAIDLAPVLAAMIRATNDDLRTMLENQRGAEDLEHRRNLSYERD